MIRTRFASVHPYSWGCLVRFDDGTEHPAEHHPADHHYHVIAHRCGYGDDTVAYCVQHEVCHLILEECLHDRPSRVLWGLAHGAPLSPQDAAYEELSTQALQRFVRAAEQPIIGGGDAMNEPTRRRDVFKPWFVFRDARSGRYVSRLYAMFNPDTTVSERRNRP